MGHHKSYCAVTHVPIRNRCVAIWTKTRHNAIDVYYSEPAASPFIRGSTDTYGNIDPDEDQRPLMVGLTKEQLEDRPTLFIDEVVYDNILNIGITAFGDGVGSGLATDNGDLDNYNLKLLGFELQDYKSGYERYTQVLKHPDYPNLSIFSDGSFSKIKLSSGKMAEHVYYPKDLLKYFTGLDLKPLKICATLNTVNKNLLVLSKENKLIEKSPVLIAFYENQVCWNLNIDKQFLDLRNTIPDINQHIANAMKVSRFMAINCIKFGPQFKGGVQDGNMQAHKELCKLMVLAHKNNKK